MFCKWCGNTIRATDARCPSCGRETPALSDCGGLYDLKQPQPSQPTAAPPIHSAKPDGGLLTQLRMAQKMAFISLIIACAAASLCLILLISNASLSARLNDVRNTVISTETEDEENPAPTVGKEADQSTDEAHKAETDQATELSEDGQPADEGASASTEGELPSDATNEEVPQPEEPLQSLSQKI